MKHPIFLAFFRWFLVLTLVIGLLLVLAYFLSFEAVTSLLNKLAPDGEFTSFTFERFQALSRLSGLIGLILVILSGVMLMKWEYTRERIEKLLSQIRDFNQAFRNDARAYFNALSFGGGSRIDRLVLLGLILVAVVMRIASLNIPLTHDEAYSYNAFASESFWQTVSDYHLPNNHVLQSIIVNLVTHLFGNQLWLIRLPSTIAGVLMVPASYMLGKRLYGRDAGLLSAAMVAVYPVLVTHSVLARGYPFLSLITLLTLVVGDQVRENKNRFAWFLMILLSALGFFTIPIMLFPFGALYIWLFLSCILGDIHGYGSKLDFLKYWLVSGFASAFLTVLLYMPILMNNLDRFFGNQFVAPLDWDVFPATIWVRLRNTWWDWTSSIPGWIVILGILGLINSLILHNKISKQRIPQQFAFLVWIAVLLIARRPDMEPRMWLFLTSPLLIWSAGGIVGTLKILSDASGRRVPLAQIFVGVVVLSAFLFCVFTVPTIPDRLRQKSSVESAAIYLADHLRDGDMVTASTVFFPQLRYYFNIYGVFPDYLRRSGPFQRVFIVVGWRDKNTLEAEAPRKGSRLAIDLDTTTIVLQLENLTIYEAYPVP